MSTGGTALDNPRIVISTAANAQTAPAVAFDGTNYLVVWADNRAGDSTDIYAARVSPTGTILDGTGIPISVATRDQNAPAVAFDGTNYLVVWVDGRSGTATDIYGSRVTKAGSVLDTTGIPISVATRNQITPAVAFDGTNYFVVWQDFRAGVDPSIYGTRVTTTGTVLSGAGTPLSTNIDAVTPALAFDGTNYLVVWSRSGAIEGTRVSKAGAVLDGSGIVISGPRLDQLPAIAFDGTNYLVVWQDLRNTNGYDIFGTRVTKGGTALDGSGIAVANRRRRSRRAPRERQRIIPGRVAGRAHVRGYRHPCQSGERRGIGARWQWFRHLGQHQCRDGTGPDRRPRRQVRRRLSALRSRARRSLPSRLPADRRPEVTVKAERRGSARTTAGPRPRE